MSIAVPLREGDEGAAHAAALLYERHSGRIFTFCLRRLRTREEAEDAVQQTFLKAFAAMRGGFRPNVEQAWLYRIAENVCADRLRALVRRVQHEAADVDELSDVLPAREAHPPLEGLDRALRALTPSQRQALLLREWQGMSYNEIAAELGLSESAVETLLFRARRSLARRLESQRAAFGGWVADASALAAWVKSLLSGGTAVKAAALAVAAGGLGAAVAAPIVYDDRPVAPARAEPLAEPAPPATSVPAAERAAVESERAGTTHRRRAPATRTDSAPTRADSAPASAIGSTAPQATKSYGGAATPTSSAAPVPPAPEPNHASAVPVPEPSRPASPPVVPQLPLPELVVPELPAPELEVPEVRVPELGAPLGEGVVETPVLGGVVGP